MEYYGGRLCISMNELVGSNIMSLSNYCQLKARNKMEVARRGGGPQCSALIVVESLPTKYKALVDELFPDAGNVRLAGWVRDNYEQDQEAVSFFFDKSKTGVELPVEKASEYVVNASVLNCCIKLYNRAATAQKLMGGKYNWDKMASVIESLREQYGHTLPTSTLRFRKKVAEYKREGYSCLISGKYGNQWSRKVNKQIEDALVGISVLPNKPYNTTVAELYNSFVCGEFDVYHPDSGELLNPDDYVDRHGDPMVLSEATVSNYLNMPRNRVRIEKSLSSYTTFMHEQMPHMHRHAPDFSFSKISFDDRDLPRKLRDSKARPKAYYAYDVASQCVVGYAYNRNKNVDLVVDCFRSMFRLIERKGWGCPAQVEVENHLMSQWRDSFLKAGVLFPFVRFCAPMNSQEKYSEVLNGAKKKRIEHRNHLGIGRFYGKLRQNRVESKKVFDELNDTYVDKEYYIWEELIADDMRDVAEFNNTLHPNQKKYPGMTRWEVLESNMNPTLRPIDKSILARFIGEKVSTSIRRNSYCRVGYTDWWLSDISVIEKLAPNNWKVEAYCLTNEENEITEVYIYQNELLIDKLENIGTYNTAEAEQTDIDREIFVEQRKKIARFNRYMEENAIEPVAVARRATDIDWRDAVEVPLEPEPEALGEYRSGDSRSRALAEL